MSDNVRYKIAFEYLKTKGIVRNQQHLADLLNINKGTLSQILNGYISPPKHFVENIASQFKLNREWLMSGIGEMIIQTDHKAIDSSIVLSEQTKEYKAEKSDLRLLLEQNAQLVKNNTTLVETISKISEELINLHRESKNAHARGDVGCADVG